ncbi:MULTISPECIES: hypothetical protein [Brucella/Ochrobactrum group]|jgi:hypothetical protein|uniref:hypothetical protein n=1 Tax=Brucella/Ochrobactrum group TaxID=2826938 RepID=UPI001C03DF62|nr:hypothetical protein [Brucella sp. NBRC 12950]QWK80980.1 hypothetical protein KMS41_20670 [Ochrobactrum sp. BTU1]GLU27412.1 hypothetical protein Brsp01_26450 [Brucella sp. NBRC 12950]
MKNAQWIRSAVGGAIVGAIATIVVGFTFGGWVTGGTSERLIASSMSEGVAVALTPYCLERSKNDPEAVKVMAEYKAAPAYSRRMLIEKSGWATPLGAEQPNAALAAACGNELAKAL